MRKQNYFIFIIAIILLVAVAGAANTYISNSYMNVSKISTGDFQPLQIDDDLQVTGTTSFDNNISGDPMNALRVDDNLTVTGDLIVEGSSLIRNYFAEQFFHNDLGETFTISAANVSYNYTIMQFGNFNGFHNESGFMAAEVGGTYKVDASISFSGGANAEYFMTIWVANMELDNCHAHRRLGATGDLGNMGLTCMANINPGDKVNIRITDVVNPAVDIEVFASNLNLVRVG